MATLADVVPLRSVESRPGRTTVEPEEPTRSIGRAISRTGQIVGDSLGGALGSLADAATGGVRAATQRLIVEPTGAVDDWGRDPVLVRNMMIAAQLRWHVSTGGAQRLPKRKGALIVVNAPRMQLAPVFTAFAISEAVDRPVRFVGRTDGDIRGAFGRRIGGLLDDPDEVAGALRADELVVVGAAPGRGTRDVGPIEHTLVGAALMNDVRVFPAASSSSPFARRARVEVGTSSRPPRKRRGPLSELELSDRLRNDIRNLLAEMGDISTGTPLDWLPFAGMGAH